VKPELVDVMAAGGAPDAEIARAAAGWQEKIDRALGEEIGWAGADFDKGSAEIRRWITEAWRAEFSADVAIVNGRGIRQGLPHGPITLASVWSVLPFDNKIVMLTMPGSALAKTLAADDVVVGGVTRAPDGGFVIGGAPLDPARTYSVATIDFLYYGGHMGLTGAAVDKGVDWRAPVIAWTRKQRSSKEAPLDKKLR
jgi:2',3'-cyclic-nucleotide 2'-phosphodiesterase (5'-nucleotidase family)